MKRQDSIPMVGEIDPHNWLDSKEIECAHCGQRLHWLRHSPICEETFFYCTQCPTRVEVSHYDDRAMELCKMVKSEVGESWTEQFVKLYIDLIEQNLTSCDCGGTFTHDAPRRCLRCFTALPQSEPRRDVYPPESSDETFSLGYQSLGAPTRPLIKTNNIWKAEV